jgi:uncharacterized YigZ family protein
MYEIINEKKTEITEKKSKFITRAIKIYDELSVKVKLNEIRKIEKGAAHNCYAYRLLTVDNKLIERKNDDGEPGGTAGAPMLAVIAGEDMIDLLVVTTRYFGGIKLGTGGLASVYKKGVKEVLKASGKKVFIVKEKWEIFFPINAVEKIEYVLRKNKIDILQKDFTADVHYKLDIRADLVKNIQDLFGEVCTKMQKM